MEEVLAVVDGAVVAAVVGEGLVSLVGELSPDRFFFLPVLKSVSYQLAPFKRNAGADSCFFSSAFWQAGQFVSGASLNFWMVSSAWPQAAHWYS